MGKLTIQGPIFPVEIECETGKVSDGYHTFDELYDHRCLLFAALSQARPHECWKSKKHHDGSAWEGWFIAGMDLDGETITYHLPERYWGFYTGEELETAPEWDGHTAADVVQRLIDWLE